MTRVLVPLLAVLLTRCTTVASTAYRAATEERTVGRPVLHADQAASELNSVTSRCPERSWP